MTYENTAVMPNYPTLEQANIIWDFVGDKLGFYVRNYNAIDRDKFETAMMELAERVMGAVGWREESEEQTTEIEDLKDEVISLESEIVDLKGELRELKEND